MARPPGDRIVIPQHHQCIPRLDPQQIAGFFGQDDLALLAEGDHAENIFSLRGDGHARLFPLVVTDEVVKGDVVQGGQRVAMEEIGHRFAAFPFGNGLPGDADPFGDRLLRKAAELAEAAQIGRQRTFFLHGLFVLSYFSNRYKHQYTWIFLFFHQPGTNRLVRPGCGKRVKKAPPVRTGGESQRASSP